MNILGIIASSKLSVVPGDFESIATTTVGSGGTATVTFSSIPATFTHLQLRGITRSSNSGSGTVGLLITYNSDTGANYTIHALQGNGSTASSVGFASQNSGDMIEMPRAGVTASVFGGFVCDILDYANTNKYKTFRSLQGFDANGSGNVGLLSSVWMNTNAITSIGLTQTTGSLVEYSSFALYGIRSA
jgi:hypothetical protein